MHKESTTIEGISIPVYSANTLIIGSGTASLNAAVNLHDLGQHDIAIVTEQWGGGTSNNAGSDKQTYYKLSLSGDIQDSPYDMAKDLFDGGCMHGDIALCEAHHSVQAFYHLVQLGVPFPHDKYGSYVGYRTDNDPKGRGTSAGPLTSHLMFEAMSEDVKKKNIPIFDHHQVISLLTDLKDNKKHIVGAVALDKKNLATDNNGLILFNAVNVILGTGGPAGIYKTSVYPESQTGSHGLAFRIGAIGHNLTESQFGIASIKFRWNLSGTYQQVIPRYISTDLSGNDKREFLNDYFPDMTTLATAIFFKGYQWPFDPRKVENYGSSLIDMLVYQETVQKSRRVFIDYTQNPSGDRKLQDFSLDQLHPEAYDYLKNSDALLNTPIQRLAKMNQPAVELYMNHGIDLTKEHLEIAVCAQHNNGGLKSNIWWESNIKHLFPVGEVNGTHGVYRPGGSALNAGQVGSIRAAMYIANQYVEEPPSNDLFCHAVKSQVQKVFELTRYLTDHRRKQSIIHLTALQDIRDRMTRYGAHIRNSTNIMQAISEAWDLYHTFKKQLSVSSIEEIPSAFRILDLCLTHAIYLEAIGEYLEKGGKSRGSYLVIDPNGKAPCDQLSDDWKYRLNKDDAFVNRKILEIWLDDNSKLKKKWVDIRPIPQEKTWFENMWRDFRDGKIIS